MEQNFYFITVFARYDDRGIHAARTWGFYDNLKDAVATVRYNKTDLWETVYDYCVIEEYEIGISGYTFRRWFYKYIFEKNEYEWMEEPDELKHYCSFAIG